MSSRRPREGPRTLTVMVVPEGTDDTRTYRIPYARLRLAAVVGGLMGAALMVMTWSWVYLARRAAHVTELEARVDSVMLENARVVALADRLAELEADYSRMVDLFGAAAEAPSELWLPPVGGLGGGADLGDDAEGGPTSWPLAERGFITQPLVDGVWGEHPGLDIAIPTDSYIRAAGGGTVADVDDDPVYGNYVVLDHGEGYRSLYAHASLTLVASGDSVRRNEVIGLSGSTGRSTAPHLHFEILHEGEAVDPMTLLRRPS